MHSLTSSLKITLQRSIISPTVQMEKKTVDNEMPWKVTQLLGLIPGEATVRSYSCLVAGTLSTKSLTPSCRTHTGKIIGYLLMLLARKKETRRCLHSGGSGFHAVINWVLCVGRSACCRIERAVLLVFVWTYTCPLPSAGWLLKLTWSLFSCNFSCWVPVVRKSRCGGYWWVWDHICLGTLKIFMAHDTEREEATKSSG